MATVEASSAGAHALLPLPEVTSLTALQARGASCVRCQDRLTIETAVDLGERPGPGAVTIFPRGCGTCVRAKADRTYRIHVANCRACPRNAPCVDRRGLGEPASEVRP